MYYGTTFVALSNHGRGLLSLQIAFLCCFVADRNPGYTGEAAGHWAMENGLAEATS